jgi:hypothetical protein
MAPYRAEPALGDDDMKSVTMMIVTLQLPEGGQRCIVRGGASCKSAAIGGCQTSGSGVWSTTVTVPVGLVDDEMTDDDREGQMISLVGGEEEERTCVGRSLGRPPIVPASDNHCHRLLGWWLDDQRRPREEEDDNFVGSGGGAYKATAAPRPGVDGTTSNLTVDEADEGAKEKTEERRNGVVWEDEERWLAAARAGGERRESTGGGGGGSDNVGGNVVARGGGG